VKILNKTGLPYSIRVLFAPGVVILPIELALSDFFEFRVSLYIKRGQGETPQSEQPVERSQKSQAKMYPRPQIHRRIQGQRLIFHFNPLATQSQPCERRQAALRVPSETIKLWKSSVSVDPRPNDPGQDPGNLSTKLLVIPSGRIYNAK